MGRLRAEAARSEAACAAAAQELTELRCAPLLSFCAPVVLSRFTPATAWTQRWLPGRYVAQRSLRPASHFACLCRRHAAQ